MASLLSDLAAPHRREDDPDPGFLGTVVALSRRLGAAIERLRTADNELYAADAELTMLRIRRDAWTEKLAGVIVRLRRKTLAEYEDPNLEGLALHSPRVYRAHPLLRQIEMVDASFQRDDVATFLGEPADDEPADLRSAVTRAREIGDELHAVLDQINDGRRRHDDPHETDEPAHAERRPPVGQAPPDDSRIPTAPRPSRNGCASLRL